MDFDMVTSVNLVLCILIIFAGCLEYRKDKGAAWLYLALAFSLFGLSHVVTLAGATSSIYEPMVVIRALGYLLVLFAVFKGTARTGTAARQAPAKHSRRKR